MNREVELVSKVGSPTSWEYLSWGGRDSHVFGSADQSRVIKLYPYLDASNLHHYAAHTFTSSAKTFLRGNELIHGNSGSLSVVVRVVNVEMIGEARVGGQTYGYAVSHRIHGPDISDVMGISNIREFYSNKELIEFLQNPQNIEALNQYLATISRSISGDVTMGNAKIVEETNKNILYITDVLAKLGSRRRIYRDPIDISLFGY